MRITQRISAVYNSSSLTEIKVKKMRKRLLLITSTIYPDNTAMYVRHHTLAKLFQEIGWEVLVLSRGKDNGREVMIWDNVPYFSVSGKRQNKVEKLLDFEYRMLRYTREYLQKEHFDAVLLTGASTRILNYLKKYAQKHAILLLHDSVEWYSPEQFVKGERAREYRKKEYWMRKGISKEFRVIAISSFLQEYFAKLGNKVIRIPAIMDMQDIDCQKHQKEERCIIMYAGSPGRKDYLKQIVEGCSMLSKTELEKLELRLIGIKKEQLSEKCGVSPDAISEMGKSINCMGRIPRECVLENLQEADFTILLRPVEARYAKAGFPTKVTESLASATPVICNITSDLGMYIKDMENGVIVDKCSAEAVKTSVERVLKLDFATRQIMSQNARKTAEEKLHYVSFKDELESLLS